VTTTEEGGNKRKISELLEHHQKRSPAERAEGKKFEISSMLRGGPEKDRLPKSTEERRRNLQKQERPVDSQGFWWGTKK